MDILQLQNGIFEQVSNILLLLKCKTKQQRNFKLFFYMQIVKVQLCIMHTEGRLPNTLTVEAKWGLPSPSVYLAFCMHNGALQFA